MPQPLPSKFKEYSFTEAEVKLAKELSFTTRCWLENELTNTMLRKVALIYKPEAEMDWRLLHAELDGRMSVLAELLNVEPTIVNLKEQKNGN